MNEWIILRNYLGKAVGIKPRLLDYIAVYDILRLCAEGYSNSRIAIQTEETIPYVQEVLNEFYQFGGFKQDLDFNPKLVYSKYKYNQYAYRQVASSWDKISPREDLRKSFDINRIFEEIERQVETYYR